MKTATAIHMGAALLVVAASTTVALGFPGSCNYLSDEAAEKLLCQLQLKQQGGGGGTLDCQVDGEMCYDTGYAYFSGGIGVPIGDGYSWYETSFSFPGGKGSRVTDNGGRYSFNTKKDDSSEAQSVLFGARNFAETANNSTSIQVLKSKKAYQTLDEGFTLDSGKLKGSARVFDDFSKYSGSFKGSFKGRTYSGRKVKVKLKLVYKSAQRSL